MGNKQIPLEVLDTGGSAYVSERKIYPRDVSGPLNRLRVAAVRIEKDWLTEVDAIRAGGRGADGAHLLRRSAQVG